MNSGHWKWVVVGCTLSYAVVVCAEDLTMTTYYPSPRGVYDSMRVKTIVLDNPDIPPGNLLPKVDAAIMPRAPQYWITLRGKIRATNPGGTETVFQVDVGGITLNTNALKGSNVLPELRLLGSEAMKLAAEGAVSVTAGGGVRVYSDAITLYSDQNLSTSYLSLGPLDPKTPELGGKLTVRNKFAIYADGTPVAALTREPFADNGTPVFHLFTPMLLDDKTSIDELAPQSLLDINSLTSNDHLLIRGANPSVRLGDRGGTELATLGLATAAGQFAKFAAPNDAVLRSMGGNLLFATDAETDTKAEKMRITADGNVGIRNPTPRADPPNAGDGNLDVNDVYLRSRSQWVSQIVAGGAVGTLACFYTVPFAKQTGDSTCAADASHPNSACMGIFAKTDTTFVTTQTCDETTKMMRRARCCYVQ